MSEVSIDHNFVSHDFLTFDSNASDCLAFIDEGFDWGVEPNVDAHAFSNLAHSCGDASQATLSVEDTVFVLEECEDCEQRGGVEWTHSEVFCLKRHGESNSFIIEVLAKVSSNAGPWLENGCNSHGSL